VLYVDLSLEVMATNDDVGSEDDTAMVIIVETGDTEVSTFSNTTLREFRRRGVIPPHNSPFSDIPNLRSEARGRTTSRPLRYF